MKSSPVIGLILMIGAGVVWVARKEEKRHETAQCRPAIQSGVALEKQAPGNDGHAFTAPTPPRETVRVVRMLVTAYCCCRICCEAFSGGGKTSIGKDANIFNGVAADPKLLPYHTRLEIPGIGIKEVDDTGGAMRQDAKRGITHIDVRMASHSEARRFGVKNLEVKIMK